MIIKCIVVDDEPSSQNILRKFIFDVDFLELITICNNATEALQELKNHPETELLFLDINMPKVSGLTLYKSIQNPPDVIFTTAYSQYAVDGFDVNAIDYLLKPFSFARFFTAANKLLERKSKLKIEETNEDFLIIKSNKVLHKVLPNDIIYIEASGDYVKIYLQEKCVVTNATFNNILASLPKQYFIRTHKSFAVNFKKIESISGNQISIVANKVPIGQKFKSDFLKFLDEKKSNRG